ncbi:MAG TPA: NAD(P)H-binding protein [Magnetospirillaceae bacterium]|nr:NAD(P)H-binding protein [Magnetospirillaceae bacterium]
MKLAVLGGTSQVDQYLLNHALGSGYSIHFLGPKVNPSVSDPELTVVQGSLQDVSLIEAAFEDAHAVICLPYAVTDFETLGNVVHTMHAFGIVRLILAADFYKTEPHQFKNMLQKAGIDWTIIHHGQAAPTGVPNYFAIPDIDYATYLVRQVTDVTNLRAAMVLSN